MPHWCCVPKCSGNYDNGRKVSSFSFAADPDFKEQLVAGNQKGYYTFKFIKDYREFESNYEEVRTKLGYTEDEISAYLSKDLKHLYFSDYNATQWKFLRLNFFILKTINEQLESCENQLLSVQQSKDIKNCLKTLVDIGIYCRLLSNIQYRISLPTTEPETADIFFDYNILKCTAFGLYELLSYPNLRILILPECLKAIITAFYQISFCPLKVPDKTTDPLLTEDVYKRLTKEKEKFGEYLNKLHETIHPSMFVKETMIVFQANSPKWFRTGVSQMLTKILRSKNGVESILMTMLDNVFDDTTKTWNALDVFIKLILSYKNFPDFKGNICKQVVELLEKSSEYGPVYERLFVQLTKTIFSEDPELSKNVFIRKVTMFFLYFTYKGHVFQHSELLTEKVTQNVRLLHSIFVDSIVLSSVIIPIGLLKPVLNVIFQLHCLTINYNAFRATHSELAEILTKYLNFSNEESSLLFDSFLFDISDSQILPVRSDLFLEIEGNKITLKYPEHVVTHSVSENSEGLMSLIKNKTEILVRFFGYLLNCLINREKYFKKANEDLLNLETEIMNEFFERNLIVYKLLSDLAEDKNIQRAITKSPDDIIKYIQNVVQKTINGEVHKTTEFETEAFQSLFTVVLILQALVENSLGTLYFKKFCVLEDQLLTIQRETSNKELRDILTKIIEHLSSDVAQGSTKLDIQDEKTDLDRVLEDICDPLLPVRGHGLMELTKLIENSDQNTLDRKQYILNIFQQNLKNEDSYIYLSAVGGLVAMANIFPDTIVRVLCEEYSDFTKKSEEDGHEVRLKIGEALVRVTKLLGEMAPKYKSPLLNAFLVGVKDEDALIRASSLSNLGEMCRVLGYKLGTVVSEVLECVHAVTSTDKFQEARRAAVTVIRQLFVGLDSEIIVFLKEDILPIYRTLKQIYNNDKDEVMRLQAQLALEQLNESMKSFVFPQPPLNLEKKIIMLD